MDLPPFDPGKAINLLVEAFVTIVGVCIGAWLAFKAVRWQVQTERMAERQLEWLEKATELWSEHQRVVQAVMAGVISTRPATILAHLGPYFSPFGS
jgi:hypothetical protein